MLILGQVGLSKSSICPTGLLQYGPIRLESPPPQGLEIGKKLSPNIFNNPALNQGSAPDPKIILRMKIHVSLCWL